MNFNQPHMETLQVMNNAAINSQNFQDFKNKDINAETKHVKWNSQLKVDILYYLYKLC